MCGVKRVRAVVAGVLVSVRRGVVGVELYSKVVSEGLSLFNPL